MSDYEFEDYLRKALSNSISSLNPSQDAKQKALRKSSLYFEDLKQSLLSEYENKTLNDVMDCEICSNSFGDVLKITTKEKVNFNIKDNDFKNH